MLKQASAKIDILLARPDVQANPLRALYRRLRWRWHWRSASAAPLVVPFHHALRIELTRTGSGALLYYQGYSEPSVAHVFRSLLREGMVCLDVGAHAGEYTLLAADAVGALGRVHCFEAQSELCALISRNVALNHMAERVTVNQAAVSAQAGERVSFHVPAERSGASILPPDPAQAAGASGGRVVHVSTMTLDDYVAAHGGQVDVIKMDIEGAEPLALRGAQGLLARPAERAPVWLFEYSPRNCARFGFKADDMLDLLRAHGYAITQIDDDGRCTELREEAELGPCNLLASKRGWALP